ncbi:MAG: MATE family efflux transporter [Ruminococcaceae bacterium]|nr:MATE family efflux transporter [Oscillospiraceae bacterium]
MQRTTDMTKGSITKLLLKFSLPLIITNIGQQLYMIADAAIVGRGVGVRALAAVGSADWLYWLILWTVMGFTQGFSVFIAKSFGEKNYRDMNKTIAMSTIVCAAVGIILTICGLVAAKPVLELLDTPQDIFDGALTYLVTMVSGTLVISAYNMASTILRALGDGKSPLIAMLVAALMNIGLDCLFVFGFGWGIFGAAFASVIAQFFSFVYCFFRIKKISIIKLEREMWNIDLALIGKIVKFCTPMAMQYMIIALGGLILQSTINLQGSFFVAGYTAVNKLYGLLECTAISFGTAFATFFSQNYGAGNYDRMRKGVNVGFMMCLVASVLIGILFFFFSRQLLSLFLDKALEGGEQALDIGVNYLNVMSVTLLILYLIYVYKNILQSVQISCWSVVSGFSEFLVRVGMGKILVDMWGQNTLYFIEPSAWLAAVLTVAVPYYIMRKRILPKSEQSVSEFSGIPKE